MTEPGPDPMPGAEPADVRGLTVRYPRADRPALADLHLRIGPGERVLVLGPSGSGKTTLTRVLAGIVPQSVVADVAGTVRVASQDARTTPVAWLGRAVGSLFQDPQAQLCLPRVDEEVAFGPENRAVPASEIAARVGRALELAGAAHLSDRTTDALSGGEQQRVALAAVLAGEPELLVLDEPTALLDPAAARRLGAALANLAKAETGAPTGPAQLWVEHRLDEIGELPTRVAVLDEHGQLVADGPTGSVLTEHGRWLATRGCWLPAGVELAVAAGLPYDRCSRDPARVPALADILTEPAARSLVHELGSRPAPARSRGPSALRARNAAFTIDGRPVVEGVDLDLYAGQITAVLGVNGAGKTTLLQGMAGLLPRAGGRVSGGPAGLVFQHPEHQFVGRDVEGEIGYGCRRAGLPPEEQESRVRTALDEFGLAAVADRDPYRLSGGEQRRLSVASMVVLDRPVLLLDEPTFGQDRVRALAIGDRLDRLARAGTAIAFATHDLRLAGRVADRVLVLSAGRAVREGPAQEVLADRGALAAAGLVLPPLLEWRAGHAPGLALRSLLNGLRERVERVAA